MKQWWINLGKANARNILGFMWSISTISVMMVIAFYPVPERNKELLHMAMGNYLTLTGMMMAYFFGSSKDQSAALTHAEADGPES